MSSRRTAPKPRQVTKSEVVDDNFLDSSLIENLEDELNYIRSQIRALKGSISYDTVLSDSLIELIGKVESAQGYYHEQPVASAIWTITHALGRYPNIIIYDNDFNQIYASVKMLNVNTCRIIFSEPVSGSAFLQ